MDAVARSGQFCASCRRPVNRRCTRRDCEIGASKWAYDVRRVLMANLYQIDSLLLVVVTAPGADVLPWDLDRCTTCDGQHHSGVLGCRVQARPRDAWEAAMPDNYRKLHRAILGRLKRQLGDAYASPLIAWVDEDQGREVFHRNIILRDTYTGRRYQQLLAELAPKYGFGFVDRKTRSMPFMAAVNYLAGYLASGASGSAAGKGGEAVGKTKQGKDIRAAAGRAARFRRVWVVSPVITRDTKVTRRSLNAGRKLWASQFGYCKRPAGPAIVNWSVIDAETGEVIRHVWARGGERWCARPPGEEPDPRSASEADEAGLSAS